MGAVAGFLGNGVVSGNFSPADQPARRILREQGHLVDRDCIQLHQPPGLGNLLFNEVGIEILKVREADQLRDIGVIPDIPFFIRVAVAPFFCGEAEERHVEEIGFGCIHPVDLRCAEFFRDQVLFDRGPCEYAH